MPSPKKSRETTDVAVLVPDKPKKVKHAKTLANGSVAPKGSESFPLIALIEQKVRESVPKEIIDRVAAVTSKKQII